MAQVLGLQFSVPSFHCTNSPAKRLARNAPEGQRLMPDGHVAENSVLTTACYCQ